MSRSPRCTKSTSIGILISFRVIQVISRKHISILVIFIRIISLRSVVANWRHNRLQIVS